MTQPTLPGANDLPTWQQELFLVYINSIGQAPIVGSI